MTQRLVVLAGPTASGKTAAAVAAARRLPLEVISADSRQIRCGMRIGTAAPTDDELAAVRHHLTGIVAPDAPWTLAAFLSRARAAMDDVWARGGVPLLLGGTGQYMWALLEGWSVPAVPPDPALRARLDAEARDHGPQALHARLAAVDPASANRIDPRNVRRVVRALEIVEHTGEPVPPLDHRPPPFDWQAIGVAWPRERLYERADARAGEMYRAGLVEETRTLIGRYGRDFDALGSIGYAEAARVVDGEWDEATALERTRMSTHRLIRAQATWFRAGDERIDWRDGTDRDSIVRAIEDAAHAPLR